MSGRTEYDPVSGILLAAPFYAAFCQAKKNSPASRGVELFDRVKQNGGSAEGGKDPTSGWFDRPASQVDYVNNRFSNLSDKRYVFAVELSFTSVQV